MESPEKTGRLNGVSMEFPLIGDDATSFTWPPRLPRRLRRRLLLVDCHKTPSTAEDIEAKLRLADLRRQQFYESLVSKARPKTRSPSHSSCSEEDLGQRLEAKLHAAEQKRLSILAKAQMRLARMDEMRQAAKLGVEMRFEKERKELVTKVESRVQQAEANRMLMLRAYRQRRATLKERSSQSIVRRMARESKYKERVRAAIQQKRVAAEKKRLGLLEAEKKRACARMLQVHQVAQSVSLQREIERRRMRDQLENRLQKAIRQRAEYLRQRGKLRNRSSVRVNWNHKQADILSRKLARCWRRFLRLRRTTLTLTKAYDTLEINEKSIKSMPFEQLAVLMESSTTLQTLKALLDRFESRLRVSRAVSATNNLSRFDNIDHLLKRVATPKRRVTSKTPMRRREEKMAGSSNEAAKSPAARSPAKTSRYPVRIVLCAYMILGHPDAVFSGQGDREIALAKSADDFVREFELLTKVILEGPIQSSDEETEDTSPKRWTFRYQLAAFDKAWCSYLNCFVAWKVKDAQLLVGDLVRAACQLELSMIQTCKMTPEGESAPLTHDMKAIQKQVAEDQKLLREKVQHLGGDAGIERMERAISETRSKFFAAQENGSPLGSPIVPSLSPNSPSSSASPVTSSDTRTNLVEGTERRSHVVRSLFQDSSSPPRVSSSSPSLGSSVSVMENELIVNELLHEQHAYTDTLNAPDEDQRTFEGKIREAMEKAFWDDIMDSMKQDNPNYDRIVELMREVRDEICKIAPHGWENEIIEAIDLDIFSQVLKSGNLDINYLGRILEFAFVTLQKLTSPANEDEMKATHQKLLKELAEMCQTCDDSNHAHVIATIKGLRSVLEQIQALKQEISKARIKIMKPLLKGPAGVDYLRKAFADRYGSPSEAYTSLPSTVQWISSLWNCKDQEWEEHRRFCLALATNKSSSHELLPPATIRTGGSFLVNSSGSHVSSRTTTNATGNQFPECNGGTVDLIVRLGLLKLVSGVSGLTKDGLPETFMLNLARLRDVQAQIQKIIVISTSILVCRQTLMSEQVVTNAADMDIILSKCIDQLMELLDKVEDAGIEEIIETISNFSPDDDSEKLHSRKVVMARTLTKSLQAGDPVFEKVSRAVYLAGRGVVLGGTGSGGKELAGMAGVVLGGTGISGKELAEMALRKIGAAAMTERVVKAIDLLLMVATVSVNVHKPWYKHLTDNLRT